MRIKFLRSIASIYGGFAPGMVADIPNEAVAKSWCEAGIAVADSGKGKAIQVRQIIPQKASKIPKKKKPAKIPKGQFWCEKHRTLHKKSSPTGMKCLKRLNK